MKKVTTVYLASPKKTVDSDILNILKETHGENTVIKTVGTPLMFNTPYGFSNLLQRRRQTITKNTARVYVIQGDLKGCAFENASTTGIPFGVLFRNEDKKWETILLEGKVGITA